MHADGDALPTDVHWGGGFFGEESTLHAISLGPGGQADVTIHWEQVPVGDETTLSTRQ